MLTLKLAYDFCHGKSNHVIWSNMVWHGSILPAKSMVLWKFLNNALPTDDILHKNGFNFPSQCTLCLNHEEFLLHLFFSCHYVANHWNWLCSRFNYNDNILGIEDCWGSSLILVGLHNASWLLWLESNLFLQKFGLSGTAPGWMTELFLGLLLPKTFLPF
ncbi:unnamed protein product [Vicia faba]|uniref:Reverse transcriptase zinc-binding domain-containing protein n=1 Tax=Vicia faba TaxID=3906 RepID=A0AAV1B6E8_VICFA|nr:unnamed protein product [Vicia faba]